MLLDLFFPRRCVNCNKFGRYFCQSCSRKIKYQAFLFCPVCRYPSVNGITHSRCRKKLFLDGFYVSAHYSGPVKKAIHLIKYRFASDILVELINLIFPIFPDFFQTYDFLIPVPLHPKKEKERGFNQSLLIALKLSKKLNIPVFPKILHRTKYTKPQFGLKMMERNMNVRGVFDISPGSNIHDKKIILVDDVATTFATLKECASVLKRNGAASVYALVLAHGN